MTLNPLCYDAEENLGYIKCNCCDNFLDVILSGHYSTVTDEILNYLTGKDARALMLVAPNYCGTGSRLMELYLAEEFFPFWDYCNKLHWMMRYCIYPIISWLVQNIPFMEFVPLMDYLLSLDLTPRYSREWFYERHERGGMVEISKMPISQWLSEVSIMPSNVDRFKNILKRYAESEFGMFPRLFPCAFQSEEEENYGISCYFDGKESVLRDSLFGWITSNLPIRIDLAEDEERQNFFRQHLFVTNVEVFDHMGQEDVLPIFEYVILLHHFKFHKIYVELNRGYDPISWDFFYRMIEMSRFVSLIKKYLHPLF